VRHFRGAELAKRFPALSAVEHVVLTPVFPHILVEACVVVPVFIRSLEGGALYLGIGGLSLSVSFIAEAAVTSFDYDGFVRLTTMHTLTDVGFEGHRLFDLH